MSLANLGFGELIGYCCLKRVLFSTAFIKSSVSLTDTFAPVTFPLSSLASINFPESGCLIEIESISAPRLPSCATSRVELEYLSMKGTTPVDVRAVSYTHLRAHETVLDIVCR